MSTLEIIIPDIGSFDDVDVIEVLVSVGDNIKTDDPLITLETEKPQWIFLQLHQE